MKIFLPANLKINVINFVRQLGYAQHFDRLNNRQSFVKRLTRDEFPRFHIYVEKNLEGNSYLTLHLDQKRPIYQAGSSHNADYDGRLVEYEAGKIKKNIYDSLNKNEAADLDEKKGFLSKLTNFFGGK